MRFSFKSLGVLFIPFIAAIGLIVFLFIELNMAVFFASSPYYLPLMILSTGIFATLFLFFIINTYKKGSRRASIELQRFLIVVIVAGITVIAVALLFVLPQFAALLP